MSRGEQAQWWKENGTKDEPSSKYISPLQAIQSYREGMITMEGMAAAVFERLTDDNAQGFMTECPPDIMDFLRNHVEALPLDDDEEGWDSMISIRGDLYGPWVTEADIRASKNRQEILFRRGVRLFRKAMSTEFNKFRD